MALQTPPGQLHFTFTPLSVSEKLQICTFRFTQFHTKLNGFHYMAYLWWQERSLATQWFLKWISKMKNCNTNFINSRFHNKKSWRPIISTFHTTELATLHPIFTLLITYLQQTEILSTHIPEIWRIQMFINHSMHITLINKCFIADTT